MIIFFTLKLKKITVLFSFSVIIVFVIFLYYKLLLNNKIVDNIRNSNLYKVKLFFNKKPQVS